MGLTVLSSMSQVAQIQDHAMGVLADRTQDRKFGILRSVVWSLTGATGKAHINRVLSVALPAWHLHSIHRENGQEAVRAELRSALSFLQDAGDLLELKGGYWAPATARFVELPTQTGYLLVGGIPSELLTFGLDPVRIHGPYRHLTRLPSTLNLLLPVEPVSSWARLPSDVSLQDWAEQTLHALERQPYLSAVQDNFEFYLPARSRTAAPQFKRWFGSAEEANGTYVARRTRAYGAREYRLVDVAAGQITGSTPLDGIDVRRLMYAFDLAANNPVRAEREAQNGSSTTTWLLTSELPRAEQRLFSVFGNLTIPDERPYERRWSLDEHEEVAMGMMRALGIVAEHMPKKVR